MEASRHLVDIVLLEAVKVENFPFSELSEWEEMHFFLPLKGLGGGEQCAGGGRVSGGGGSSAAECWLASG